MERFYTLQGEGFYSGNAAYFIRLGGCDVGCHWCDVKESWDSSLHPNVAITDLVEDAVKSGTNIVVITGGEPLMHDLTLLTKLLQDKGLVVNLETSGAHAISGVYNWICLSPKKFKQPLPPLFDKANELKIIVFNKDDFKWAEENAKRVGGNCKLYLQPEWDKKDKVLPLIIEYIQQNPKWQLSLQTHKYINIP
ncbi:MAG: radical SAM protein [Bacteroidetes bacterium]|nr:radical SAM protein [Bacteroidota bacterium]